jgi:hypothetical protein
MVIILLIEPCAARCEPGTQMKSVSAEAGSGLPFASRDPSSELDASSQTPETWELARQEPPTKRLLVYPHSWYFKFILYTL